MIEINFTDPEFLHALFLFFFIISVFAFFIGLGLAFRNALAFRMIGTMNSWVSMRRLMRPMEIPHDIDHTLLKHSKPLGVVITVLATGSLLLLAALDPKTYLVFTSNALPQAVREILADSFRWFLLIGNGICIVAGSLMLFNPELLTRLETHTNHWFSIRKRTLPLESMHMNMDRWALTHPELTGGLIVMLSLSVATLTYHQL